VNLFFDTETTGKADFRLPPDAKCQPRIVQLAALLTTFDGQEMASLNVIIKPDGFTIPKEASDIHGITTELALGYGVEEISALRVFDQMLMRAQTAVAHNFQFDHLVLSRRSIIRNRALDYRAFCTMRAMTPICKLPNTSGYSDYKRPKLQEAYKHCYGVEFDGAHDAMADVRACAKVYFWLQDRRVPIANEDVKV